MPLQNVLVVKGGESNADNTQVRRISAAGDGHLRRRGLSLSLCRLNSRADAEDVYQEVFLRLLRDDTDFRDTEHLKAWLLRVTLSRCADLRRSAWFKRTAPMEAAADAAAPEPESSSELWQAVHALPEISESRCGCTMWRATAQRRSRKWSAAVRQRYARGCIAQESN